jgi:hypothetical protein
MIQELLIPQRRNEQLQKAVRRDMIRLASVSRPSLRTRLLDGIGAMLIAFGESLRRQPTDGGTFRLTRPDTRVYRALEQRTALSQSET